MKFTFREFNEGMHSSLLTNVLGAREASLSVLVHFFENGRFESLIAACIDEQILAPED
jgi:hypothetical protein